VAPAIAPDGTIYTISRADLNSRYAYVVAVNPDLTPKWAASMRDRGIHDGCGVLIPIATQANPVQKGKCRWGNYDSAHLGVDPNTNQMPAGRVIDQSSSSPTVLPDGSVLYGAYSRYNVSRGHLFKFSSSGAFISYYDFGWDSTPAVWSHAGTYSVVIKDNHYDEEEGFYCNNFAGNPAVANIVCDFTGVPAGPFYITQLSGTGQDSANHHMAAEWKFQSTNTMSCTGDEQPQHCVSDHPHGFEWCINAPAVDGNGTVYNNSEDGRLYALPQGHTGVWNDHSPGPQAQHFFTNLALGAAYTPLSVDFQGRIFTQNDGHLFVVGGP
jgi:outer membrane protein assembly factor BamB